MILRGRIPSEDVSEALAEADAALMTLKDLPLANITLPAKLQSYFACGKPVLASVNGESAKTVEESRAGFVSPSGDAAALAENVLKMYSMTAEELEQMGKNAEDYCKEMYSKQKLMNILTEELKKSVKKEND